MAIPDDGGSNGNVRLDPEALTACLERLRALERRLQRRLELTSGVGQASTILSKGGVDLAGTIELRDQYVIALSNARNKVRKISALLGNLQSAADKAGGYVLAADRHSADDIAGYGD